MAAGKRYSAGAIFLQVVPVFSNVQRAIEDEAKGWDRTLGDRMEQAGDKAGERAGKAASRRINEEMEKGLKQSASDMEKALGDINTKNLGKKLRAEVKAMREDLASLNDVDLKVDANFAEAEAKLRALRASIEDMRKRSKVFFDIKGLPQVYREIKALETRLNGIRDVNIDVDVDTKAAERKMGAFEKSIKRAMDKSRKHIETGTKEVGKLRDELDYLSRLRVGVDIGSNQIRKEVGEIMADLKRLSMESPDIDVRFEAGKAYAELAAWEAAVRRADGNDIETDVRVNSQGAERKLLGVARSSDDAANSFRSFNGILFAVAGAGPAVVPMLGAIAGGLLAIGPAAAVAAFGLGSVLVGFSGLGDAMTALQSREDQAAMNAQTNAKQRVSASNAIRDAQEGLADAERATARAIADAERGVADARRNAARAAEDAARRVADARQAAADAVEEALDRQKQAQEDYRDSIQDVQDAEQALRDARAAAAGTGESLDDQIRQGGLAIDQAVLDSFDATNNYNAVMADGSSTNAEQEQARITREQALEALHELRETQADLVKQKRKWDKQGVNGTETVQSAQDNLTDAIDAQKKAYEGVRDAAAAVDKARVDGAQNVRDAIQAQNDTLADNARAIADAQRSLADAQRDGARRMRDAREAMADARQGQEELNDAISSQDNAVNAAFSKLGPAGRRFALFLFGLRDEFYAFRDEIQQALLPDVQTAIEGFLGSGNAEIARDALVNLAGAFGEFTKALSTSFQGKAWEGFFEMLRDAGPGITESYGNAFISFMEAMASMMTTLAPFAEDFADGLERISGAFADWAASESGQASLTRFMEYAEQIGPKVTRFLGALTDALINILVALAPWGSIVLTGLTDFLEFLADMDPKVLGGILTTILIMITASQTAYAVMNLLMAGGALLTSSVGLLVFAWVALGAAVLWVYQQNETLGIILGVVGGAILGIITAVKIWKALQIAWIAITNAVALAQTGLGVALLSVSWPIVLIAALIIGLVAAFIYLWKNNEGFRDFVIDMWAKIKTAFKAAWEVAKDVLAAIGKAAMWLWNHGIKPALSAIGKAFAATWKGAKWAWEHILWPVIKAIGKFVWNLWKIELKVAFVLIAAAFKALGIAFKWVWEHGIKPVFGWVAAGAKWLWEKGIKPPLGWIGDRWDDLMTGMKYAWDHWLAPVFDAIREKVLPKLKGAFESTVDAIKAAWDGLKAVVAKPIKFVIDKIINHGLIDGFNKIADWVNMDGFDYVDMPSSLQAYASGGVMPGYTPGRDVHSFYSPTAGRLDLSGGEAVMRPEWTSAVGPDFVNQMNAIARNKGVKGIRQAMGMGGYWMGGVLPFPGASVSSHGGMYGHPAYDLNYPGYADYGQHVGAWKAGRVAQMNYIGDDSYGRWVVLNHASNQSTLYAHLSAFANGLKTGMSVAAGQWIGNVGDLGNTGTPPTSHLHFEIMGGNVDYGDTATGGGEKHRSVPGFIKDMLLHPLSTVKGWATSAWDQASDFVADSPVFDFVKNVPTGLVAGFGDKAWDMVPGWAKSTVGVVGDFAGAVKDGLGHIGGGIKDAGSAALDAIGLAEGGILPYNGTMMYDNGGYLPPGLTTVVNLTGKPEPVFTNDQWSDMGAPGGNIHYEPHFEGTNLTPEDVAADLNFTFRRIKRGGKYAGVGQ